MKMTMLGSGGVALTPRPTCSCRLCNQARTHGIPYARTGTSLFVHGANVLFDTPEESRLQLTRENIHKIGSVVLTHWHPDHTLGLRVLEQINWSFPDDKPFGPPIQIFISRWQYETFKKMSCGAFLDYYEKKGIITIRFWEDKEAVTFPNSDITITPYLIEFTKGFYYLIDDGRTRILYIPCEYHHLIPDPNVKNVDILIVHNLFWENPNISPRKRAPTDEDTFEQMLSHADTFGVKNIIITHIEESFGIDHDELNKKMKTFYPKYNVVAGYDGLTINL